MDVSKKYGYVKTKGLISVVGLAVGVGAVFSVQAELKSMDDSSMAYVTGQAGLTIDIDVALSVGELAYRDGGFLTIEDFRWGGAERGGNTGVTGTFENWRMVLDVADGTESLAYGFSALDMYHSQVGSPDADWEAAILANDDEQVYGDGDLVIHNSSTELFDGTRYDGESDTDVALSGGATALPSNSFTDTMDDWRNSAPFGVAIGAVKLRDSGYSLGSKSASGTTLMSNFNAEVLTGPLDIVMQNKGDGITLGVPDSKITISDYFEISDLSVKFDFLGVSISGFKLHNRRGDTTGLNTNRGLDGIAGNADDVAVESFGFAHAKWYIGKASPLTGGIMHTVSPSTVDGIQIAGALKGDIDIQNVYFGDTMNSIGSIYVTDMTIQASLNISAH